VHEGANSCSCYSLEWMAKWSDQRRSDFLHSVIVRPLLLAFWLLILWGTVYGLAFLYSVAQAGPRGAFERVMAGPDRRAGVGNLALSACAGIVWGALGAALWRTRLRRTSTRDD
jgi:hypothetical protein